MEFRIRFIPSKTDVRLRQMTQAVRSREDKKIKVHVFVLGTRERRHLFQGKEGTGIHECLKHK